MLCGLMSASKLLGSYFVWRAQQSMMPEEGAGCLRRSGLGTELGRIDHLIFGRLPRDDTRLSAPWVAQGAML